MAQKDGDVERIKLILEVMEQHNLIEVELAHDNDKIVIKRSVPPSAQHPVAAVPFIAPAIHAVASPGAQHNAPQDKGLVDIKSPIVGTFYAQPSPDSDPFVDVGSRIDAGAVVCIIEAMKVMNEIKAEVAGTISQVVVKNGQAVEFGQVLFRMKPD